MDTNNWSGWSAGALAGGEHNSAFTNGVTPYTSRWAISHPMVMGYTTCWEFIRVVLGLVRDALWSADYE